MSSNLPYIALLDGPAADILDFFQRRAAWHISDQANSTNIRLDALVSASSKQLNRMPTVVYDLSIHPLHPRRVVHRLLGGWRSVNKDEMVPPGVSRCLSAAGVGPALIPDPFRPEHVTFPFLEASFTSEDGTSGKAGRVIRKDIYALSIASTNTTVHARTRSTADTSGMVIDLAVAHRPRSLFGFPMATGATPADSTAHIPPLEFYLGALVSSAVGSGTVNVGAAATICGGTVRLAADADVFRRVSSSVMVIPTQGVHIAARVSANLIASGERFAVGTRVVAGPLIKAFSAALSASRADAPPKAAVDAADSRGVLKSVAAIGFGALSALGAVFDVHAAEVNAVVSSSAMTAGFALPVNLPIWPHRVVVSWGTYARANNDVRSLFAVWTQAPVFEPASAL